MVKFDFSRTLRAGLVTIVAGAVGAVLMLAAPMAQAQDGLGSTLFPRDTPSQGGRDKGQYIPGIALTPDGCEVWIMDDGAEGYASGRLDRKGMPICRKVNTCGVMNTDQFFATDSHRINAGGKKRLAEFFRSSNAFAFSIVGHTDSRASDSYNMRLSYNRAIAVARVAKSVGARIVDVRGYGERMPVASNASAAGMAKNRRVEIQCFQ